MSKNNRTDKIYALWQEVHGWGLSSPLARTPSAHHGEYVIQCPLHRFPSMCGRTSALLLLCGVTWGTTNPASRNIGDNAVADDVGDEELNATIDDDEEDPRTESASSTASTAVAARLTNTAHRIIAQDAILFWEKVRLKVAMHRHARVALLLDPKDPPCAGGSCRKELTQVPRTRIKSMAT